MEYSELEDEPLVRACIENRDPQAWEEFVRRFQPFFARVVIRTARSLSEAASEDVIQDIFLKLCADRARLLRNFEFRGKESFYGFLKTVGVTTVYDRLRRDHARRRGRGMQEVPMLVDEASPAEPEDMQRRVFLSEVDRMLVQESSRDRQIFWLHYRQGFSTQAISGLPGIGLTAKGVESVLQRLRQQIRDKLIVADRPLEKDFRLRSRSAERRPRETPG